ncbi:MAG: UDP-N-acetylmuramoyl-L-alanyl-D-glutamate--2,6-diaminopimelate ligase [Parcubacteria group bacterium]|nr:UDP-N-acetylmuramoyl-L-alanyl-D-glutamate--2,6-diaminopimelate ligase [Parcubacteria group bacterium]
MKNLIKKFIPKSSLDIYHKALAITASIYYGRPSSKMIVIGVTGTKGKSTTCNILWHLIEEAGHKCGMTSTANFRIHKKEWVNKYKMTMLGRFKLQKLLKDMVEADCKYAIVETSSEGIKQWRHLGINYDIAIFLNLTPEHIESHGGFENYKQTKAELFKHLKRDDSKGEKVIIANKDDKYADYFLEFEADKKITYGVNESADVMAYDVVASKQGINWKVKDTEFSLKQIGKFNIYNALPVVALGKYLDLSLEEISKNLAKFTGVPGRMEMIDEGQKFRVIVDYAYEPKCLEEVLINIKDLFIKEELNNNIIAVSGPTGGGRDSWRRPVMGEMLAQYCKHTVVTTDDPYDDNPNEIADEMIKGFAIKDKIEGLDYFKVIDRREAIKKALLLAEPNDVVLIAGKGSDPVMAVANGKSIPWDDRKASRELLKEIKK